MLVPWKVPFITGDENSSKFHLVGGWTTNPSEKVANGKLDMFPQGWKEKDVKPPDSHLYYETKQRTVEGKFPKITKICILWSHEKMSNLTTHVWCVF